MEEKRTLKYSSSMQRTRDGVTLSELVLYLLVLREAISIRSLTEGQSLYWK